MVQKGQKGQKQQTEHINRPVYLKFLFGGMSGICATCICHPMDLIKNRMQLMKETPTVGGVFKNIVKNEGILGFYGGLSASVLRQATYTTGRLGMYNVLEDLARSEDGTPPGFLLKAALGMVAGACGAFVGTPSDVILVRMTADGRLPEAERRNYKNVFDAISRIIREEGPKTLFRGVVPTIGRSMVLNAVQLASYSQTKEILLKTSYFNENIKLYFCASMISGLFATIASMPVDIIKSRIQNMKAIDGKPEYSGIGDVVVKLVRNEGVLAFWKGFIPYYARMGPITVLIFVFYEQFQIAYDNFAKSQKS